MCKSEDYVEAFSALGREVAIDDEAIKKLERFVCHMYGKRPDYSSPNVNILRYALYCQKGGKAFSEALPPCADVLRQHINRANYQSFIWRKSTEQWTNIEDPVQHGWILDEDGILDIKWMTCQPAPDEVYTFGLCLHWTKLMLYNQSTLRNPPDNTKQQKWCCAVDYLLHVA